MSPFKFLQPLDQEALRREPDPLRVQREIMLQYWQLTAAAAGVVGLLGYLLRTPLHLGSLLPVALYFVLIALQLIFVFFRRVSFPLRLGALLALLTLAYLTGLLYGGATAADLLFGVALATVAAMLIHPRAGFFALLGVVGLQALTGWAFAGGRISPPAPAAYSGFPWLLNLVSVIITGACIVGGFYQFGQGFRAVLANRKRMAADQEREQGQVESRDQGRAAEYQRKANQLLAAQKVISVLANETQLQPLLLSAVNTIREQFNAYHVAVYLNDPGGENTILRAASGDAAPILLAENHRFRLGEIGFPALTAASGETRVSGAVLSDAAYYPHPLLPQTRSEAALPLTRGEKVIGVLDIHSLFSDAFTRDDVQIFETIANQLSLAMDKTRLVQELQTSLALLETNLRQNTAKDWRARLRGANKRLAYQYKHARVQPPDAPLPVNVEQVLRAGTTLVTRVNEGEQSHTLLSVPIMLRNHPLGVVNIRLAREKPSPEMISLVENAVSRLSVSLENVRLVEELQLRANRERMVGEIATKVRAATNVETILRTAANEIGRSLGVSEVVVQLTPKK